MFFSHGHQKYKDGVVAIFSIGSARVTGSLVSRAPGEENLKVHYSTESTLVHQDELNVERFTRSMLSALMEVAMRIQQEGLLITRKELDQSVTIKQFACVFTAPWYVSQTHTVTLNRKQEFVVKESIVEKMLHDEIDLFQENIKQKKEGLSIVSAQSSVADAHIIQTHINGYETKDPIGKTAQKLSISLYISLMSDTILSKTQAILSQVFAANYVSIISSTLVTFLGVEKFFKSPEDYLILETHGEVTDATLVRGHTIVGSASFPFGTNTSIRYVTKQTKRSAQDIYSRVKLMSKARTNRSTEVSRAIEESLFESIKTWLDGLHRTLEKVAQGEPVPQTIYLSIDPQWHTLFLTALKQQTSSLITFSDRPFEVVTFDDTAVKGKMTISPKGKFLPLTALAGLMHKDLLDE